MTDLSPPSQAEDPLPQTPDGSATRRISPVWLAVAGFLGLLIVIFAVNNASTENASDGNESAAAGERAGDPAPEVAFDTFAGTESSLANYRGGPLVLNFFASWCAPCVAEMPDFEAVHQQVAGRVGFLGLATSDRDNDARGLVERTGVTYDLGFDPNGEIFTEFEALGMPTTAFISADGRVLETHTGILTQESLNEKITELFG